MQYIPPRNGNLDDPNRPYINAEPTLSVEGSVPVAEAFEHHQRELVHLITEAGLQPSSSDLTQVLQAVKHFAKAWFPKPKQVGEVLTNTAEGIAWVLPALEYLERYRVSRIGHIQSGDYQGLPGEFCIADGRQVLFENYPELHEKIVANKLHCIGYDSEGAEREKYIGCYMYNEQKTGVFVPNVGGYFERYCVDGQEIDVDREIGTKQDDAIRNITGKIETGTEVTVGTGCLYGTLSGGVYRGNVVHGTLDDINIDSSRVVPTADDNRPYNIATRPIIYLGKVVDTRR